MINQKLIAEVEALRAQQSRALKLGRNGECFIAETYGLLKMARLLNMTEESQWLSSQWFEMTALTSEAVA